jgi:hypothetical protein
MENMPDERVCSSEVGGTSPLGRAEEAMSLPQLDETTAARLKKERTTLDAWKEFLDGWIT